MGGEGQQYFAPSQPQVRRRQIALRSPAGQLQNSAGAGHVADSSIRDMIIYYVM
jgi:hypothetical protein